MATGSGTGTPALSPSAVSASSLITDHIRIALDDALSLEFTDAELLSFLNEAIREYTQHFPRNLDISIVAVPGQFIYPLPSTCRNILTVEYPADHDPPIHILRITNHPPLSASGPFYEFIPRFDQNTAPLLRLSESPAAGSSLRVTIQQEHNFNLLLSDNITVPADHHHILVHYTLFACARQQLAREEANPTSASSLLMAQYASNTRRYEVIYLNAINRIIFHRRGISSVRSWTMDFYDRIY